MHDFNYRDGVLFAEQRSLTSIAEDFGTPTYVYSRAALERQFRAYQDALAGVPHLVCFAVKANSNLAVLDVLARLGAGFDIVSGGELARVIAAGGDPGKVVFSGVAKQDWEILEALSQNIHCFNVESRTELDRLSSLAGKSGRRARVSLRVNPDVDAQTHPYISTGLRENKFGIAWEQARESYRHAAGLPHLEVTGVDCHIGSQLTSMSPLLDALDKLLELIDQLAEDGIPLQHLDLGGGIGVRYRDEQPPAVDDYIAAVRQRLGDHKLTLMFEPGRSICANAGVLLTRVDDIKPGDGRMFAIVDGAMNDMLRPALYDAWMDILPVQEQAAAPTELYDVVGPVCETGDFLGKGRELSLVPGDLLAVMGAGAYGFTMSSNYNSRGRAAEILVDGERAFVARERETLLDLMRGEHRLPTDEPA
ncbi:MAG: diaminopimelate decarboxylase [Halieaceae bacterium]|jgi:diaminopimelate decarboxylase|nr:diaminopimelate decarboxylase [Halieaceae bacterium]